MMMENVVGGQGERQSSPQLVSVPPLYIFFDAIIMIITL
jgi:hypothetical protein